MILKCGTRCSESVYMGTLVLCGQSRIMRLEEAPCHGESLFLIYSADSQHIDGQSVSLAAKAGIYSGSARN